MNGENPVTKTELQDLLKKNLPTIDHHGEIVEMIDAGRVRLRLPFREAFLGADVWQDSGGVVYSGPLVMGLADTAMYACLHASLGADIVAVMVTITITFLRPAQAADLIAEARIIRQGKRLVYLEATLTSEGDPQPVSHVTSTYSVRAWESVP